jgi:hypothetical protein
MQENVVERDNANYKKILKSILYNIVILFLPSIWFPIVINNLGSTLQLVYQNTTRLNIHGWVFTVIVYGSVLCYYIITSIKNTKDEKDYSKLDQRIKELDANLNIYEHLIDGIGDVCSTKYDTLQEYIKSILKSGKCYKPFDSTIKPDVQLKNIAKEVKACLGNVTRVKKDKLVVSMAYNFPNENNIWKWIDYSDIHGCETIDHLVIDHKSTFYKIMTNQVSFVFYNDKIEASKQGNYIFDSRDISNKCIGSIICEEIQVEIEGNTVARIILSASSYSCKFTDKEDTEVINNIENTILIILQQFEKRIRIELAEFYIKEEYRKYDEKKVIQMVSSTEEKPLLHAMSIQ